MSALQYGTVGKEKKLDLIRALMPPVNQKEEDAADPRTILKAKNDISQNLLICAGAFEAAQWKLITPTQK